jgi:type IV secretory pathway VirB3-like protein
MIRKAKDYPILRRPRLRAGVGAKTFALIWMLAFVGLVLVDLPWGLLMVPVGGIVHFGLAWTFRADHEIFALYTVYEALPNTWVAGNGLGDPLHASRPKGFYREGGR